MTRALGRFRLRIIEGVREGVRFLGFEIEGSGLGLGSMSVFSYKECISAPLARIHVLVDQRSANQLHRGTKGLLCIGLRTPLVGGI